MIKRKNHHSAFTRSIFNSELPKGWRLVPIGDALLGTQYGLSEPGDSTGSTPIVGMRDINRGSVNLINLPTVDDGGIDWTGMRLRRGDILLNRTNSADLVGKAGIVREDSEAVFASYLVRLEVDREKADPEYVNYWLNAAIAQTALKRLSTRGVSQANINPTEFRKHCPIVLPPLPEQSRILAILQTWDEAIEKTEALIDAKGRQFGWLAGNIYNNLEKSEQKEQKEQPLSLYMNTTKHIHGNIDATVAAVGKSGIRDRAEIYSKELSEDYSKNKLVYKNEIAFGLASDCIVYGVNLTDNVYSVSPAYKTFNIHGCNSTFLKYLLDRHNSKLSLKYLIASARQGKSVDFDGLLNEKFAFPSVEEQEHIAHTLNTAQQEIKLLEKLADQYRTQKRGLMQKLLSGEWRVAV